MVWGGDFPKGWGSEAKPDLADRLNICLKRIADFDDVDKNRLALLVSRISKEESYHRNPVYARVSRPELKELLTLCEKVNSQLELITMLLKFYAEGDFNISIERKPDENHN